MEDGFTCCPSFSTFSTQSSSCCERNTNRLVSLSPIDVHLIHTSDHISHTDNETTRVSSLVHANRMLSLPQVHPWRKYHTHSDGQWWCSFDDVHLLRTCCLHRSTTDLETSHYYCTDGSVRIGRRTCRLWTNSNQWLFVSLVFSRI